MRRPPTLVGLIPVRPQWERIYAVVRRIPRGRVASYGQVARLAGLGRAARQVGRALHALGDPRLPWHRVVNARGALSLPPGSDGFATQRRRLEREGVAFDRHGCIDLQRFGWRATRPAGTSPRTSGGPVRVARRTW